MLSFWFSCSKLTAFFLLPFPAEIGTFFTGDTFFAGAAIFFPDVPALVPSLGFGFFDFSSSGATNFPPFRFFKSSG